MRLEPRAHPPAGCRPEHPCWRSRRRWHWRRCRCGSPAPTSPAPTGRWRWPASARWFALSETLTRATPLILTGLAVAVAFRARLWNIGAEGQLYLGAVAAVALGSGALAAAGSRPGPC